MLPVESPFKVYTDRDGKPLNEGYVYFGEPDQNPITAPVTVYWDAAGTQPAAQPLRTDGGYIIRAGSPANVFFDGAYSELVQDKKKQQVFYARTSAEFSIAAAARKLLSDLGGSSGAASVGFLQLGVGATMRTAQDKLREFISVKDFGAKGDGVTNDTAAIQTAILAGAWNGTKILVPNGTYAVDDTLFIGTNGVDNFYSVHLEGESAHGSVFLRNAGKSGGPILTVNGFHNIIEKLTLISAVSGGNYTASHGIYLRGNPQAGTNGLGTKYNVLRNLLILRCGTALQIGNYDVDGKDPDIETNSFHELNIYECNVGVFINGQNILHNPFYSCHIVNCRDYLVRQKRGGDVWFERSYFGGMYDYLTANYNVPTTSKILVEAGVVALIGCRSEEWHTAQGNLTPRYALNVTSTDSKTILIEGNTFTARDNSSEEPSIKLRGQGTGNNASVVAMLLHNVFHGYVEYDTLDVFSMGNTYKGTGTDVVNGRKASANQKTQQFRDLFLDSNQEAELNGAKFKRNSAVPLRLERDAVAVGSEWLGMQLVDAAGLMWGGVGMRVTNATAGQESAVLKIAARHAGGIPSIGWGSASAIPTAGTWTRGDTIENSAPAVGSAKAWKCTVSGTPGTWVSTGNL